MFRFTILYLLFFSFVSCSSKEPITPDKITTHSNQKLFEEEDFFILSALHAEQVGDFNSSIELYNKLYTKTERKEYLYRELFDTIYIGDTQSVLKRVEHLLAIDKQNERLIEIKKIALYHLAKLYNKTQNIDGMLSIYLELYKMNKSKKIATKIAQIYSYQQDYKKLVTFLEHSQIDDKALLTLYATEQDYTKAYMLAYNIYVETGDLNYLGQSAIYQYESATDKNDTKMLKHIVEKLTDVVKTEQHEPLPALYLNYLGYILIDHKIDITKGISYIKTALKVEPNSAFYLDSLAWGYYRLGNCKDAKEIMNQVVQLEGGDNKEVILHINSIDRCLKN